MIWNYCLEEIEKGYQDRDNDYCCIICKSLFTKGRIYPINENYYDALGAIKQHKVIYHGSMAAYLLNQEPNLTGLSEIQSKLLSLLLERKSDQEIAKELGIAQPTVRNHRFKLREKEKQAKLFVALMASLEEETSKPIGLSDNGVLEEVHAWATMIDDRYDITDKERQKTIAAYMDEMGGLKQFPAKEKKKIIVLTEIAKNFKQNYEYTEAEIDRVLKRIYEEDYPTIRRSLIEYGFMDRTADCSIYQIRG